MRGTTRFATCCAPRAEEKVIDEYIRKGLPPPPLARPGDADILPPDPSFGRRR
jgi:hypothetical protein